MPVYQNRIAISLKACYVVISIQSLRFHLIVYRLLVDSHWSRCKRLLDDLGVDVLAELHALLELRLIVRLSALRFNVLLNSVNLRLVHDQLLLNVIELVVDVTLQDKVLLGVMTHGVVRGLLWETMLVRCDKLLDSGKSCFFFSKLSFKFIGFCKLIGHFVLHLADLVRILFHLFVNTAFQILYLL